MVHFGEFLKIWNLRSASVTRQVTFNRTQIGGKRQKTFWTKLDLKITINVSKIKCYQMISYKIQFLVFSIFAGFANFGSCDFHLIKPPLFRGESKQQLRAATSNCDLQFIKHCRSLSLYDGPGLSHLRLGSINIGYKAKTFGWQWAQIRC